MNLEILTSICLSELVSSLVFRDEAMLPQTMSVETGAQLLKAEKATYWHESSCGLGKSDASATNSFTRDGQISHNLDVGKY